MTLGAFPAAAGNEEAWIAERLASHRNPTGPIERRLDDGRWILIREQRTAEGGIVGIGTDITALKQAKQKLRDAIERSEEHTSELQSLMRISYAAFCLKKKTLKQSSHLQTTSRTY